MTLRRTVWKVSVHAAMSSVVGSRAQSAVSTRTSGSSGSFDMTTKCYNHPSNAKPTGRRMLYTGPDRTLFQRVTVENQGRYVGHAPLSAEVTSEATYLYTSYKAPATLCKMRHNRPGEIGWNVPRLLKNAVLPVNIAPGRR